MVMHLLKSAGFILSASSACKKISCRSMFLCSKLRAPTTVNAEEVKKFEGKSGDWWNGLELLHLYNSVRVPLIRDGILSTSKSAGSVAKPLEGYSILDVGCGGGILSESLARLGAKVTGLDPGAQNVEVAIEHASKSPEVAENVTYICDTVENLASSGNKYDAVVASEVIEHVNNVSLFVQSCVELTMTDGSLFFTTINKTNVSYFLSIVMAEYVLNLVPRGTHDWNKFVTPKELIEMLESLNCQVISNEGIVYNPVTRKFSWCKSTENLYSVHAVKL